MPQKELERRILALALAEGSFRTPGAGEALDHATSEQPWGGDLQRLLDEGRLRTEDLDRLLWEALQHDPEALPACPESWTFGLAPVPESAADPENLGPYRDLTLIGSGGHARVYRAFDGRLQRWVALKVLRGGDAALHMEEARAQARVEHPNVCKVYEVAAEGTTPFIALQLVAGRTLADFPIARDTAVEVLRDVAEALHAAHKRGLVHLDVKPANVLLEVRDQGQLHPLVTDFGLVALRERGGRLPSGTPPFAAPEQLDPAHPALDRRADVYGLGATLYTLLARALPFDERDPESLLQRIRVHPAAPLDRRVPGLPRDLSRIVAKAMAADPADRYPTALAFAEDLQRYLDGEEVLAAPSGLAERFRRWQRRNPALARLALGSFLFVAGAGLFGIWTLWKARSESAAATQIGAEATQMEDLLRMAYLAPPHDLRAERNRIRQKMGSIQLRAKGFAKGPAAFALGRGNHLLGQLEEARGAFEAAGRAGFRAPLLSLALGRVLGELYREALRRTDRIPDPGAREARRKELARELREPAVAALREAARQGMGSSALDEGSIALVEGKGDEALAAARRALEQDPTQFEALRLEAQVWMDRAGASGLRREEALAHYLRADAALTKALAIARSDIRSQVDLATCRLAMADANFNLGHLKAEHMDAALAPADAALRLDPEDPAALLAKAGILSFIGNEQDLRGQDPRRAFEQAITLARKVSASAETRWKVGAFIRIAQACHFRKYYLIGHQDPATVANLEMGADACARASALDPRDGGPRQARTLFLVDLAGDKLVKGGDPFPLLEEARREGEEALRIGDGPFRAHQALAVVWQAIARARWAKTGNPEEAFAKAGDHLRQASQVDPSNILLLNVLATNEHQWGEYRRSHGGDPRDQVAAGAEAARKVLAVHPGDQDALRNLASLKLLEADAKLARGEDPRPALEQAEAAARPVLAALPKHVWMVRLLGFLEFDRAQWSARQGASPLPSLVRTRGWASRALAIQAADTGAFEILARSALLEARWRQGRGEPVASLLAAGLAFLEKGIAADPDQEIWFALKTQFKVLASRSAPLAQRPVLLQEAKESLERARAISKDSLDTVQAEKVLAGQGG